MEIELSVFSRQCLNRRVGDEVLRREVAALERERNDASLRHTIAWPINTVQTSAVALLLNLSRYH